jgi:voltage-gated potassium channel
MNESRAERWERSAQLPLMAVSLLFVAAYAWPILDTGLDPGLVRLCSIVVWLTWAVLALELVVRFVAAENKWAFARKHPLDIAAVVLPILRPLRLLRLLTLLDVLNRYAGGSLRGRVGVYLVGAGSLIVFMGSLAILDAERGQAGPIQTFGDAIWWALATITTVGYGDMYPVTGEGRFVAAGLMFCGIGVLGVVTGTFASWLVERVEQIEDMEEGVTATADDVRALREEIVRLREDLQEQR